jgi:hypothetical protein
MAELSREQHESLSGAWSDNAFFDGIIAGLGGMIMPAKAEQTNGNHFTQIVNLLDSLNRRLANCFQGYVYKDSADADGQFSVKPFVLEHRGLTCAFAGATAQGPLLVGSNLIWADLSLAPALSISFGGSWPATPHVKLATITMPASGSWLPDALASHVASQAIIPTFGVSGSLSADLLFDSSGSFDVAIVPAGSVIVAATIIVHVAFDGAAPTIKVGDSVDDDSLFLVTEADLKIAGRYDGVLAKHFAAQETIRAVYVPSGSTSGFATIHLDQR